jgi:hypothetical protein
LNCIYTSCNEEWLLWNQITCNIWDSYINIFSLPLISTGHSRVTLSVSISPIYFRHKTVIKGICTEGLGNYNRFYFPKTVLKYYYKVTFNYVGFEVLTAVVMKNSVFWDITPCSPLKVKRRMGETCRLHLQGRRVS